MDVACNLWIWSGWMFGTVALLLGRAFPTVGILGIMFLACAARRRVGGYGDGSANQSVLSLL